MGSVLGAERSPGEGNDHPPQYSWLENHAEEPAGLQVMGSQSRTRLTAAQAAVT